MKIDNSNKRLKHVLDATLLAYSKIFEENSTFSKKEIELLFDSFKDMCKDLEKIDKNMTETKILTPGEVNANEAIPDTSNISSNYIRNAGLELLDELSKTKDDFYSQVIQTIYTIAGMCSIYLKNTSITEHNVDFKEVEDQYE